MGFPLGYTDILLPKILLQILTLLSLIRKTLHFFLSLLGLPYFLEPDMSSFSSRSYDISSMSVSAALIRELLPVIKFSDLEPDDHPMDNCAVCLYEFCQEDEIRRLANCKHVFHRKCLDGWMDHDQKTCPLCRTVFIPSDMQEDFNERLWLASGISDFYGEYTSFASGL